MPFLTSDVRQLIKMTKAAGAIAVLGLAFAGNALAQRTIAE